VGNDGDVAQFLDHEGSPAASGLHVGVSMPPADPVRYAPLTERRRMPRGASSRLTKRRAIIPAAGRCAVKAATLAQVLLPPDAHRTGARLHFFGALSTETPAPMPAQLNKLSAYQRVGHLCPRTNLARLWHASCWFRSPRQERAQTHVPVTFPNGGHQCQSTL